MGWISWFSPGLNIKRWLLLFAVGVLISSIAVALLFNYQVMGIAEEVLFQLSYMATGKYSNNMVIAVGAVCLIIGFFIMVYATRRIVFSIVDTVIPEKNSSLMETIFINRKLMKGPSITVVGGGTGLSTLLRGIKYITNKCNAVVTVTDDGGSSGRLRQEMGIIPPGDLRNCLISMADREPVMDRIMQYRFEGDSMFDGHCFGNLFLAAIAEAEGGMEEGLKAASQLLNVRGNVTPSTLADVQLQAKMADGSLILGETEISNAGKQIVEMKLVPENAPATKSALKAIEEADVIILGPGSLYTSVIPNLLVKEIRDAIVASKGVKIYICNVMTQPGETDGYGAFEHVKAIVDVVGEQFLDYVVVNDQNITAEQLDQYKAKGSEPVSPDIEAIENLGIEVVSTSLISNEDFVRHNPKKLAQIIIRLIYHLRLFGKGFGFIDYVFVRQIMHKLQKQL